MWDMTSQSCSLLVLTCLILVTSVMTSSSQLTWQPSKWLNEYQRSSSGLKSNIQGKCALNMSFVSVQFLVVTDTNETIAKILHNEQLTNCELRFKQIQLELENIKLKQQYAEKSNELEIHKLKSKHVEETNLLTEEKLAAQQETIRYKREFQDFNAALEKIKSELREEFLHLKPINSEANNEKKQDIKVQQSEYSSFKESTLAAIDSFYIHKKASDIKLDNFENQLSKIQNQNDILNVIFNLTTGNCDEVRNLKVEIMQLKKSVFNISENQTKNENLQKNSRKMTMKNITELLSIQKLEAENYFENCSSEIKAAKLDFSSSKEEIIRHFQIMSQTLDDTNGKTILLENRIQSLEELTTKMNAENCSSRIIDVENGIEINNEKILNKSEMLTEKLMFINGNASLLTKQVEGLEETIAKINSENLSNKLFKTELTIQKNKEEYLSQTKDFNKILDDFENRTLINKKHIKELEGKIYEINAENCSNKIIDAEKKIQINTQDIIQYSKVLNKTLNDMNATTSLRCTQIEGLERKMGYLDYFYTKEKKYDITGLYEYEVTQERKTLNNDISNISTTTMRLENKIQEFQKYTSQLSPELQHKSFVINGSSVSPASLNTDLLLIKNQIIADLKTPSERLQGMDVIEQQKFISTIQPKLPGIFQQIHILEQNVDELFKQIAVENEVKMERENLENDLTTTKLRLQKKFNNYTTSYFQKKVLVIKGLSTSLESLKTKYLEIETKIDQHLKTVSDKIQGMSLSEQQGFVSKIRENFKQISLQINNLEEFLDDLIPQLRKLQQKFTELGMVLLGDNFYYFSKNSTYWYGAQRFCRSHGLELASLETEEENRLVVEHKWKVYGWSYYTWIGGTDEDSEGQWRWSGSGQAVNYTNWRPGQPNGGTTGNCMFICGDDVSRGAWCDLPCSYSEYYICEAK